MTTTNLSLLTENLIFGARTVDEAKAIILTAEDIGVDKRRETGTADLIGLIRGHFPAIGPDSAVLDYGLDVRDMVAGARVCNLGDGDVLGNIPSAILTNANDPSERPENGTIRDRPAGSTVRGQEALARQWPLSG